MSKRKPSSSSIRPASTASRRRFPCFSSPYHFSKSPHSPLGASRRPASLRSTSAQPVKMFFTSTRVGCGAAFKREGGWERARGREIEIEMEMEIEIERERERDKDEDIHRDEA